MKCPSCQGLLVKSAKFCGDCGAVNPGFKTTDERLTEHEKEIAELKEKRKKEESDDDSLLS